MEEAYILVDNLGNFIWGGQWGEKRILPLAPMVFMLLGTGLFFMIRLRGLPLRRLFPAFASLWRSRRTGAGAGAGGEISPWNALSTALSGQVGTGNLAGVATALTLGGPGAIFWMWVTALLGMAAAFAESSLAVRYREYRADGRTHGGPMYYIRNGLGKKWHWLAVFFAAGTVFSALVTGNMIQANSIATAVGVAMPVPEWASGGILSLLVFTVIIGGIKSIGAVAGRVVPVMVLGYVLIALVILVISIEHVPAAFMQIFTHAFGLGQAAGGLAGYGVLQAVRYGVARGLFSNEAGQGSTPIAHAAAITDDPVRQGEIAMLGAFIDTIVICTITALVILSVSGTFPGEDGEHVQYAWQSVLQGAQVTTAVFSQGIPAGGFVIALVLSVFAFTTILGWSYYLEQAVTYLFGDRAVLPFRFIWVGTVFAGALQPVDFVWRLGDLANALMTFPNLVAILLLSPVVVAMAKQKGRL